MSVAIITGSAGLIGSEAAHFFASEGLDVVGIDNDMRAEYFGPEASTVHTRLRLEEELGHTYRHRSVDIRSTDEIDRLFGAHRGDISVIVHAAAQPSHDWAAGDPRTDFAVNAVGTQNLLEATRRYAPETPFIFTSTNKVYGARPNDLPLIELETRWELPEDHDYYGGIREDMSIDQTLHSVFGVSKVAADIMVQEYERYFGLNCATFRGGCLTGPNHAGAELHGFLAYLIKCAAIGRPYTIFGYKGKQVRDNIYSVDLISAFAEYWKRPTPGAVYNMGGGRFSHCSMKEAIALCEEITGRGMVVTYDDQNRTGDHMWWVSDTGRFQRDYPDWRQKYDVPRILEEMHEANRDRWLTLEEPAR
jgi:CDP-paratose 2-epimerase